jgi:hydrogenase maturation protein HypF
MEVTTACDIRIRGVVQGVGFRPFVFRLAQANTLTGWVGNDEHGVEIHLEGSAPALDTFVRCLAAQSPPAAKIVAIDVQTAEPTGFTEFTIRDSHSNGHPSVRISPDLPVCAECLADLSDPANLRYRYPYINCTSCGPRYSVILGLPYDRARTTMHSWPLDAPCAAQYHDPADRRFHAQPVACPACGPHFFLQAGDEALQGDDASIARTVEFLKTGRIVAMKGLGGYHLSCDARNAAAVKSLRDRKFRKEKPFALMVRDLAVARELVCLSAESESLLTSVARPIVLVRARVSLAGVSPENDDLGIMLPYTPLHHLLFAAGAPEVLVMTSANRSSEPISYRDEEAIERLAGIADAFLIGERPIARRVDDSIARAGCFGPVILRRARGYAPSAVATIPIASPVLATGADLKNAITLVVDGQALVSQHIGDLDHYESFQSFRETIGDFTSMYEVPMEELIIARDAHPQYLSSTHALSLAGTAAYAIQHHRAHIASVLAERAAWDKRVLGVSFDGTGYGDARTGDEAIWGGEFFVGSIAEGFDRIAHLRPAGLPGGDAASRCPVQAAAGFANRSPARCERRSVPLSRPLRQISGTGPKECSHVPDDLDWPALRCRCRIVRIHARNHLRRSGRDVGGTSRARRGGRRAIRIPLREKGTRFPPAARSPRVGSQTRTRLGAMRASISTRCRNRSVERDRRPRRNLRDRYRRPLRRRVSE